MEIISVIHSNFLVEVEFMRDQDRKSSPKSSWRFMTNALNISYEIKVAQNITITHIDFLEKTMNVTHARSSAWVEK